MLPAGAVTSVHCSATMLASVPQEGVAVMPMAAVWPTSGRSGVCCSALSTGRQSSAAVTVTSAEAARRPSSTSIRSA